MPLFRKASAAGEQKKRIYSEDEIKQRLEHMSPEMQNTFIRMAESLLHKESQMFLDIVAQSRQDILDVGQSIKEEQDVLKTTAKFLARERNGESEEYAEDDRAEKTKIHFETEYNKKAVADYLKAVGRNVPNKSIEMQKRRNYRLKTDTQYIPEYARKVGTVSMEDRPSTAMSSRPGTAYRMRMLADDASAKSGSDYNATAGAVGGSSSTVREVREATFVDEKVKEEKEELMEQMKRMDSALNDQKERQQEAIQARKEARKAKKEAKKAEDQSKAMELMEGNQEAEEQKRKNKERQEQILKERLAKKKLERRKTLQDLEVDDTATTSQRSAEEKARDLESQLGITRAKTSVDPAEAEPDQTKKKKKKKQQQETDEVPKPVEANWDVNEPGEDEQKKTKKKKKKAAEESAPADESAPAEEKKKKKKKKKEAAAADTVLDLEEPASTPVEKKKKKKNKKLEELDMSVSEV